MSLEPTCLRLEDMDRVDPGKGSLKSHSKPLILVAEIHTSSTKHCVFASMGVDRDNLLSVGRGVGAILR